MSKELKKIEKNELAEMERELHYETAKFELMQRKATALSKSVFFPDAIKNDIGSAVVVYDLAERMNLSVLEVAQSIFIIYGKPSFSTAFLVSRLNQSGLILGDLQTVIAPDKKSAFATAIDRATGNKLTGMTITMDIAEKEGWLSKKGSKWKTMPELMLRYRSQSFFIREFYPQVMFGTHSKEELTDVHSSNFINTETEMITEIEKKELPEAEFKILIERLKNFEILISGVKSEYKDFEITESQQKEILEAGKYTDEQLSEIVELIDSGKYTVKDFRFSLNEKQIKDLNDFLNI